MRKKRRKGTPARPWNSTASGVVFGGSLSVWLWMLAPLVAAGETDLRQQVDRLATPYIEHGVVIGMTIGVLADGHETIAGYGRVCPTGDRVPDANTVYEIGSITKPLTGILLGDAVARGEVTLRQPAGELLPEQVDMPVWPPAMDNGPRTTDREPVPIQLWHLAVHTSGLPRLPDNMQPADPSNPYADFTADRLYAFLNDHELRRAPGERYEYSNLATGLLGYLLARRAETDFPQRVAQRIAQPLGMTSTAVELSTPMRQRLAPPHRADGSPAANWDFLALAGAGGIRSTAGDMIRLLAAHLDPPDGTLAEAIELAWAAQPAPAETAPFEMGLGWHLARDGHTRWHNGQTGGYRSMALVSRRNRVAVVVLANTATAEVDRLAEDVFRVAAGHPVEPRRFEPATQVEPSTPDEPQR